jgi:hypothetical protein
MTDTWIPSPRKSDLICQQAVDHDFFKIPKLFIFGEHECLSHGKCLPHTCIGPTG